MSVPVVVSEPAAVVVLPKPKHTLLPLLVVLFLISYGLMAVLVVEQGRTIESQRTLIRQLFSDSTELSAMKGKAFQDKRAQEQDQAQAQSHAHAQTQVRPLPQGPITQVVPQSSDKNKNSAAKFRKPLPPKPSEEGQEMADERRSLKTI